MYKLFLGLFSFILCAKQKTAFANFTDYYSQARRHNYKYQESFADVRHNYKYQELSVGR